MKAIKNPIVYCLKCGWKGAEKNLIINKWGWEFCPKCKEKEYLRDLNEKGEIMSPEYNK